MGALDIKYLVRSPKGVSEVPSSYPRLRLATAPNGETTDSDHLAVPAYRLVDHPVIGLADAGLHGG
jgi:hypothetical protein